MHATERTPSRTAISDPPAAPPARAQRALLSHVDRGTHTIKRMQPTLVTTIIPVHNRSVMLGEAVASVVAQTYRPIEIIIVDDGSTDETARVADELANDFTQVIHQANAGPGAAREAGRLVERGEFVQHLDSDDLLLPRKFELQVAGLRANPDCGASYGWTRLRRRD